MEPEISNVTTAGKYAYVYKGYGNSQYGVDIVDISVPQSPRYVNRVMVRDLVCLSVVDSYMYRAIFSGLEIVDVSDPTNTKVEGFYNSSDNTLSDFTNCAAVSGNYTYIGNWAQHSVDSLRLQIVDVSDPSQPKEVGKWQIKNNNGGVITDVVIAGKYAYVTCNFNGSYGKLLVIDISNPNQPIKVGEYDSSGATNVAISGNYAYLATGNQELFVIDISDPSHPKKVSDIPVSAATVHLSDNYAYVTLTTAGLDIVDISNPIKPLVVATYLTKLKFPNHNEVTGLSITNGYAYVATSFNGLRILDVKDPAQPKEVGSYAIGTIYDLALSDDNAYLAFGKGGLAVIDVSNPNNPYEVGGTFATGGKVIDVAVSSDKAYVADDTTGLHIIDVTNPNKLVELGSYKMSNARGVTVSDNYAYVIDDSLGIRIINVSDPHHPFDEGV